MSAPSTSAEEPCDRVGDGHGRSHVIVEFFSGIGGMRFAAEAWAAAGHGREVEHAPLVVQGPGFRVQGPGSRIQGRRNARTCCSRMRGTVLRMPRPGALHPGVELRANLKSISHRCHPILVAFVWELTKEIIHLLLGCLQGGAARNIPPLSSP